MSSDYLAAVMARRTYYSLSKRSPIGDGRIQEVIGQAVLHAPSSFNSQSSRVILLLNNKHDKLWDMAKTTLKTVVPAHQFPATEQKLSMFHDAYGTVC
jgi:predicted oxidoreductase (fatty acid repression mutant protein)